MHTGAHPTEPSADAPTDWEARPPLQISAAPVVPDYTLIKQVGRGSDGEVWLARNAEFSPDGQRVITACDDGTARVWEFQSLTWPVEDLRSLAQLLSGRTIDATGSFSAQDRQVLKENLQKLKSRQPEYFSTAPATRAAQP